MNFLKSKFNLVLLTIIRKINQIQFRIVAVFLCLMITSASIIIIINYNESQIATQETSLITTEQIGYGAVRNLDNTINSVEMITLTTASFINSSNNLFPEDDSLNHFLFSVLVQNPLIAKIRVATTTNEMIAATNLTLTGQDRYHFHLTKTLPQGVRYGIQIISQTTETWKYYNTNFLLIGSETSSPPTDDPKSRPWFTDISVWPRIAWTEPYNIAPNVLGLTFSAPVIVNDSLVAIVATDLALSALSRFLSGTVVGKTGKIFVLNSSGEIILPQVLSGELPYIVQEGYSLFSKTEQRNLILEDPNDSYILDIFYFPLDISTEWIIITAVPFRDFFDPILKGDIHSIQFGLLILFLSAILIYYVSGKIAKPIKQLAFEVEKIKNLDFEEGPPIHSNIYEISLLSYSIETMRNTFASFTKYVPKDIVKNLFAKGAKLLTGGERKTVTILFSDIENFTTIAESLSVEELTSTLTDYFEVFSKIIVEQNGTIDKYIGDSIMAIWNAPNSISSHAEKACEACLNFITYTKNASLTNPFLKGNTRFGINTGEAIVGNIGTTERISYTAIGTVVNTAARFQTLNKTYHTSILIGESVREAIPARFITRPLELIAVKGRHQPIQIYELMGITKGEPASSILSEKQVHLAKEFTDAFYLFHKGNLSEAKNKFLALAQEFPDDEPTKIYIKELN
jgi:adenylate cyclase